MKAEQKARELFSEGKRLSKYDLAAWAFCNHRTAQRALDKIEGKYICDWRQIGTQHVPVYKQGDKYNKPKPKPKTHVEINRKYMSDPENQMRKLMRERIRKIKKRIENGTIRARTWCDV